jgi:hypothetical protein
MAEALSAGAMVVPAPTRRPWYATMRWRLAAVAAAALIVAAALVGVSAQRSASIGPAAVRLPTAAPDSEAAQVLEKAALTAKRLPPQSVSPDQFVFVEQVRQDSSEQLNTNGVNIWTKVPEELYQWWLSADGRSNGLIRSYYTATMKPGDNLVVAGCRDGHPNPAPGGVTLTDPCTPTAAYLGDLPTSTDAMVEYLYHNSHGQNPPDQQAFITVGDLVRQSYVPPAALSALFSAAARIPGVSVDRDIVDAVGRHGIAVGRTFNGIQDQLIFDSTTYTFLGERSVAIENIDGLTPGWVLSFSAMLRLAIVDRPGQFP